MVKIFLYGKLTNIELIKKINDSFLIYDAYIIIKDYDTENNILEISADSNKNNKILSGKIVNFNMKIEDIIKKINGIDEFIFNNDKYILNKIWANKYFGGIYETYIIYCEN
jgi:hypothetical protein